MNESDLNTEGEQVPATAKLFMALLLVMAVAVSIADRAWAKALACRKWLKVLRICSWCKRRMGGNPFSSYRTHGICPACLATKKLEMERLNRK